ncbi:MAG: hypothetical protein MPJ53_00425 [Alphaproteobacteria bacterium]|nr:hypothetical protein [Alphaproteobacteria bacterium]
MRKSLLTSDLHGLRRRHASRRGGFTILEVIGALAVVTILLSSMMWLQYGTGGSFRDRVIERHAQYLANVMRSVFEAELEYVRSDFQQSLFLSNAGLSGGTLPNNSYDVVTRNDKIVPPAGYNLSSRNRENGTAVSTAEWLQGEGLLAAGLPVMLSSRAIESSRSTGDVPIQVYFGRIRPDALVAGLCGPRFRNAVDGGNAAGTIDSDGDGTSGNCRDRNTRDREPDYGYRPLGLAARIDSDNIQATDSDARDQLLYPFTGYYESSGEGRERVVVTDDTLLALVVKTDFDLNLRALTPTSLAGSRHTAILRRAAEILTPYGGWGVLEDDASDYQNVGPGPGDPIAIPSADYASAVCLPHITDLDRSPRETGGCVSPAEELYKSSNGGIVSPHLTWRFLWRELPVLDPDDNPGLARNSVQDVPGQLFMIALLGRRESASLTLQAAETAAVMETGVSAVPAGMAVNSVRFTGGNGLVDAPATSFRPGRNIGFVFAEDVTIDGDLIVDSDAVIEGSAVSGRRVVAIPDTDLVLEGGHFSTNSPYDADTGEADIVVLEGATLDRLEFVDPNP